MARQTFAKSQVADLQIQPVPATRPNSGDFVVEQHQYWTLVKLQGPFAAPPKTLGGGLFDLTAEPQTGFDRLRYGARLTYSHVWRPVGVAKGHLLHSLPLAPGES